MPSSQGRRSSSSTKSVRSARPSRQRDERPGKARPSTSTVRKFPNTAQPAHGLNPAQLTFALHYLANGFNATQAYRAAYPNIRRDETAAVAGHRLLRTVKVATYIAERRDAVCKPLHMSGDEALAHMATIGRNEREKTPHRIRALKSILDLGKAKAGQFGADDLGDAIRADQDKHGKAVGA